MIDLMRIRFSIDYEINRVGLCGGQSFQLFIMSLSSKLSITDLDLAGKRVLIRVDFNVPIQDGDVSNPAVCPNYHTSFITSHYMSSVSLLPSQQ